ncbi:MAG TPA: glutathione-disulfide reductase [Burkholderiaceae bacterium]|nr:glutathione-disulfide reductase [Burkholderiaceae bacterium]
MQDRFDLITIGAGSGGVAASRRAAALGARVAIVEADRVGGTCVIRGCVPKKLMMYAAAFGRELREAGAFGWEGVGGRFDIAHWARAKAREIDRLEGVYRDLLQKSGVTLVRGQARLRDAATVDVGGRTLTAPRILLAMGAAPAADALPGLLPAMTSNEVLDLTQLPASLLVVGAGYIAVEFASILAGMGVAVTMAFRDTLPLRGFDVDLRRRLAAALESRGIRLAGGVGLKALAQDADGFTLSRADGSRLSAAAALNATGRRPNSGGVGLDVAAVALDAAGAVKVDADNRTTAAGIWAIGDVTNRRNLTPVAIAEGRAFAETEFGGRAVRVDHRTVATAVFTDPPLATVGLPEEVAAAGGPVDVYESEFRPMKSAFAGSDARTYMKLVVDGLSDRVLGVHMLGPDAPEIVQSLAVAMTCGATKRDFDRTLAVHPTAAEEWVLMREPARRTHA